MRKIQLCGLSLRIKLPVKHTPRQHLQLPALLETIDESRQSWRYALQEFDLAAGQNLVDYITHKIIAAQKCYIFLLKQARNEGLTAWPAEQIKPLACVPAGSTDINQLTTHACKAQSINENEQGIRKHRTQNPEVRTQESEENF